MSDTSKTSVCPRTHNQYKELISSLPQENGWKLADSLCKYQGFWCQSNHLPGVISAQQHFKPQPGDIIVCSFPKAGTTWLKALAFAIANRKSFDNSTNPLFMKFPHDLVPCLEIGLDHNSKDKDPKIPLLASHLPYNSLPKSIIDSSDCKIIYISRDSKDVLVSGWHFVNKAMMSHTNVEVSFPLDEAFELYHQGVSAFGPYWDHVLGYWKASLECPEKVLFVKYEDLKNDPLFHVKRMAKFMGHPFSLEEEKQGVVEKIVNMCSFENLSTLEVNKRGKLCLDNVPPLEFSIFFRKGKMGDWRNYLTDEMAAKLDQLTKEKFGESGLA